MHTWTHKSSFGDKLYALRKEDEHVYIMMQILKNGKLHSNFVSFLHTLE